MRQSTPSSSILLAATFAAAIALSSCSEAADEGLEQLIEQQTGENVEIDSENGGFSVETEDGSMTIDEDGNFVVTDEDGETVTGQAGAEDGDFQVESDDGSFRVDTSGGVPEEWPSDIPQPEGLGELSSTVSSTADELLITITGKADAGFVDDYGAQLESSGFEQTSSFESADNVTRQYENATWYVSVNAFPEGDAQQIAVSLYPVDG
jgi:hypothetical protein